MEIKLGSVNDAKAVAAVEAACFPAAEAATETELTDRLRHYGATSGSCGMEKNWQALWTEW